MKSCIKKNPTTDQESGNAIVEFLGLGFMLFVPSLYFLLLVFALQSAGMAATAASQQAIQTVQNSQLDTIDANQVQNAAIFAASDYSIAADDVVARLSCSGSCVDTGSVTVEVTVAVRLPLIPFIKTADFAHITSSATAWGGKYQ